MTRPAARTAPTRPRLMLKFTGFRNTWLYLELPHGDGDANDVKIVIQFLILG